MNIEVSSRVRVLLEVSEWVVSGSGSVLALSVRVFEVRV